MQKVITNRKEKAMKTSGFPAKLLSELAQTQDDELRVKFPNYNRGYLRRLKREQQKKSPALGPDEKAQFDLKERKLKESKKETDKKYKVIQEEVERLSRENAALMKLSDDVPIVTINPLTASGEGEATAIAMASDWHIEERVTPEAVNGLNSYSVATAKKRAEAFFQVALRLRDIEAQNTPVPTMVLALLGDFITGHLHEENFTVCSLEPAEAAAEAQGILASGIDFLLANSDLRLVVPCHAGNHGRMTLKYRSSETEMGNSLEFMIYHFLRKRYEGNERVQFMISRSYTSKLQVYGTTFRLHHGHRIRYQGGVGGLDIPAMKYILRSNRAWQADFDLFGHHHTKKPSTRFFANGSLIGYNAYAQDNGFEYEDPSQTFLLVHKRFPKEVIVWRPILV